MFHSIFRLIESCYQSLNGLDMLSEIILWKKEASKYNITDYIHKQDNDSERISRFVNLGSP